jgi:hypothetical protein
MDSSAVAKPPLLATAMSQRKSAGENAILITRRNSSEDDLMRSKEAKRIEDERKNLENVKRLQESLRKEEEELANRRYVVCLIALQRM